MTFILLHIGPVQGWPCPDCGGDGGNSRGEDCKRCGGTGWGAKI